MVVLTQETFPIKPDLSIVCHVFPETIRVSAKHGCATSFDLDVNWLIFIIRIFQSRSRIGLRLLNYDSFRIEFLHLLHFFHLFKDERYREVRDHLVRVKEFNYGQVFEANHDIRVARGYH